jgi:transposase, IS30 family
VPGHWGSDLILGARNAAHILTLVEHSTRFVLLQKIPYDRHAERVALLLGACVQRLPVILWRSITHDQGTDMADHAQFTLKTNIPVFFCDPTRPGNAAATKTPMGFSANTSPQAPTAPSTAKPTSTPSPPNLTAAPAKPSTGKPLSKPSTNT